VLRAFYRRLRAAGKLAKVALIAVARKLLTIVKAMLRDGRPWGPATDANWQKALDEQHTRSGATMRAAPMARRRVEKCCLPPTGGLH
jgi:hypothetical protein